MRSKLRAQEERWATYPRQEPPQSKRWNACWKPSADFSGGVNPKPELSRLVLLPPLGPAVLLQNLLAQPQRLRRDLDHLIFRDELDSLLQIQRLHRHKTNRLIRARGAHVGRLLFAHYVHVEIVVTRVLSYNHAFVDFNSGPGKENAAFLQSVQRIGGGDALTIRDQRAGGPLRNLALVGDVAIEQGIHDYGSACLGQHLAAQTNQPSAGHAKLQTHAAGAMVVHLGHLAFTRPELFNHRAGVGFRNVDGQMFDRLQSLAVHGLGDDLRTARRELKTLAAHHLNQDCQLQFASAEHLKGVR